MIARSQCEGKLSDLRAEGMTNLWDGLQTGLQILKNGADGKRMQHVGECRTVCDTLLISRSFFLSERYIYRYRYVMCVMIYHLYKQLCDTCSYGVGK